MSTVRLRQNDGSDKAGAVVSRPFGVARQLVAEGTAEYPNQTVQVQPAPAKPAVSVVPKADHDKVLKELAGAEELNDELTAVNTKITAENAKLKDELAKATAPKK